MTYFIVMELVDGPTLAELIDSDQRLPEAVVIDYAEQICRALAYAHRQWDPAPRLFKLNKTS